MRRSIRAQDATGTRDAICEHREPMNGEHRLIASLRRGNEGAFDELVNRHHGALIRMALGHVADREAAEKVVQETWLAVIGGLNRFEAGRPCVRGSLEFSSIRPRIVVCARSGI